MLLIPILAFSQNVKGIQEIAPFSEGLAAVRKGDQWGFINTEGKLVIDFRSDLVWNATADEARNDVRGIRQPQFRNGLVVIKKILEEEEIPVYGFMDTQGKVVIEPEYLNVTEFDGELAVGILLTKTFRGENNFQLRIYDYKFSEVVLNPAGEIMRLIEQRNNIQMSKRRYVLPELQAKLLGKDLLAIRGADATWELLKLEL